MMYVSDMALAMKSEDMLNNKERPSSRVATHLPTCRYLRYDCSDGYAPSAHLGLSLSHNGDPPRVGQLASLLAGTLDTIAQTCMLLLPT